MSNSSVKYNDSDGTSTRSWMNTSDNWYYYDNTSFPYSGYYDYDIGDLDKLNTKIDFYIDITDILHEVYWPILLIIGLSGNILIMLFMWQRDLPPQNLSMIMLAGMPS